ncbi:MAG: hypothetical protein ACPG8W_15840 [Candidatus Promineifilaceae bacterium]
MMMTDPHDRSIPGYPELSKWPRKPGYPAEILGIWIYRDGGTIGITIKGAGKQDIELFFDRVLGRLCYGLYETKNDAAFIKKHSAFEKDAYAYLEKAGRRLTTKAFSLHQIETFHECFQKAKVYSGVTRA